MGLAMLWMTGENKESSKDNFLDRMKSEIMFK